jgi:hypothetical protein
LALSGDTFVVGAPANDPYQYDLLPGSRVGAAYVFVRQNGVWTQQARLVPRASSPSDLFGFRVAIQGDTILVGAPSESSGATRSGAVYEWKRSNGTWSEGQRIKPATPIANSMFGWALAIDGDDLLVGASQDSTGAATAGSAYIFNRRDGSWQEQQRLRAPEPAAEATFGWQVALLGDTAVVTAAHVKLLSTTGPGEAFIFTRTGNEWTLAQKLTAPYPGASDLFGSGLALSATALVIGANGDDSGARGAGGDPARDDSYQAGAVYVYAKLDGKTWTQTAYLKPDNTDANDAFGQQVAATDDMIVVGAPFESSAARGINGDDDSNGASKSGAVYVYR